MSVHAKIQTRTVALVGNPNSGKSALFNALTGARQKIANYAGVTVERKAGRLSLPSGESVELLDLPGSYSFDAASPDEAVTREVVKGSDGAWVHKTKQVVLKDFVDPHASKCKMK